MRNTSCDSPQNQTRCSHLQHRILAHIYFSKNKSKTVTGHWADKQTDTTQCQISTQAVGHKVSTIIQDGECCMAHLYSGPPSSISLQPNNVVFFKHHMILLCGVYIVSYVSFLLLFCLYTLRTTKFSDSEIIFKVWQWSSSFLFVHWLIIYLRLGKTVIKRQKSRFLTAECLCYFNLRGLNFSPCWISCFCCTWRHKSLYPYHCHTSHLTGMLPEVVNLLL